MNSLKSLIATEPNINKYV